MRAQFFSSADIWPIRICKYSKYYIGMLGSKWKILKMISKYYYQVYSHCVFSFFYRRWGFMVPWVLIYGLNILGLFTSSIICFYSLEGGFKALGLIPLLIGCFVLVGHFAVLYFLMDQRTDFMSGACNAIVSEASTPAWEKEEEEKKTIWPDYLE